MTVDLRCEAMRGRAFVSLLRADAKRLLTMIGCGAGELSLLLVDDPAIRRLNRRYRGRDQATDVLSFGPRENGGEPGFSAAPDLHCAPGGGAPPLVLGDIVISVETMLRQAKTLGVRPSARIRTLLIHGLLHLFGYDHERSAAEARRMFARERQLTANLEAASASAAMGCTPVHPATERLKLVPNAKEPGRRRRQ